MRDQRNSIGFFDGLKGILLLTVVWVHVGSHMLVRYPEDSFVRAVEVVRNGFEFVLIAFFMLAGLFFKETDIKKCIKKETKNTLKPYLIVMIFASLGTVAYSVLLGDRENALSTFFSQLSGFLLGVNTNISLGEFQIMRTGAAWFLLALYIAKILLNCIFSWCKEEKHRAFFVGIVTIAGMCLTIFPEAFFCIPQSFLAVGFMYIGHLLNVMQFFERKQNMLFWVICILLIIVMYVWGGPAMAVNHWPLGFIDYFASVCVVLILFKLYYRFYKGEGWLQEKLAYLGRCSLWGMCVHAVEMRVAWWFIVQGVVVKIAPILDSRWVDMIMESIIDWTITIVGTIIVDRIIKEMKRKKARKRRRSEA